MTNQRKVDQICKNVKQVFDPPRIKFMKISSWPASTGMRIGFDYRDGTKVITFSKRYIDENSEEQLANFLDKKTLSRLKMTGNQHLQMK